MARLGPARFYSSTEAQELLAGPLFYILAGHAEVQFPSSSRAAPAPFVRIIRTSQLFGLRYLPRFPVTVQWKQWKDAVVPVLSDPRWDIQNPLNKRALSDGNVDDLIHQIGQAVQQSFQAAGYGSAIT